MTRHSLDCPTVLVVFKITHQDRAGETGTVIRKEGEIVGMNHEGHAVIAADSGEIILVPADMLHPVTAEMRAECAALAEHDFAAAAELERWLPAQEVPFTLDWKPPCEIAGMLRTRDD